MAKTAAENAKEDREDTRRVQNGPPRDEKDEPWYRVIGPGVITGAADDDPSGVGTYSATGAQFGYSLLWLALLTVPLMIAVQEMCGRVAAVTNKGLTQIIKERYSKWLLYPTVALLLAANVCNIFADVNIMAASTELVFKIPFRLGVVTFMIVMVATQILVPYRIYASLLKWLCLAFVAYIVVVFMPGMKNNWPAVAKGLVTPHMDFKSDTVLTVVAFLGTTISPYLFFWQAGETVEETIADGKASHPGTRFKPVKRSEIRRIRSDTAAGMIGSQIVAVFIVIAAAGTLHASGKTNIDTAADAAKALAPLGPLAVWIFTIGIIGCGLIAIPTLAGSTGYAMAELFGWRYGLYRRFSRAKAFYVTIAVVTAVGALPNLFSTISPVKALVYSAALNGMVAPPLMVLLLFICNDKKIIGGRTNKIWSNLLGIAAVVLMGAAAVYLIYAMATGKS